MLSFLPAPLLGALSLSLHTLNTLLWFVPIVPLALIKLLLPLTWVTNGCNWLLNQIASAWITINNGVIALTKNMRWSVEGARELSTQDWYLVIANHQSWVDIMVMQKIFNRRIPLLKFFLKRELLWMPVLGLAWWALDFPFMKRYSKSYLKKNPHKKGDDIKTTLKACEKFKHLPISITNFVEGTRFTPQKHQRQNSPFRYLLKPKAGGVGYVLTILGSKVRQALDVSIYYPQGKPSFWDFLCGKVNQVKVKVERVPLNEELLGDYINDAQQRQRVQDWLNRLWHRKDEWLDEQHERHAAESKQPVTAKVLQQ